MPERQGGSTHSNADASVIVVDKRVIFNTVFSALLIASVLSIVAVRDTVVELKKENQMRVAEANATANALREMKLKQEEMIRAQTLLSEDVRVSAAVQSHFNSSLKDIKTSVDEIQRLLRDRSAN